MLSEALRLLRVFHDMKQNDLAAALDISKSYISEIENGNRVPSLDVIQKYAVTFKVPVSSILFFSEQIENAQRGQDVGSRTQEFVASKIISILRLIEEKTQVHGK